MDSLFKALNDSTRRSVLELLRKRSMTAGEIAVACRVSKPTLSHHLDLLMRAELIEQEKEGQFRRYHLNTSVVEDIIMWLNQLSSHRKHRRSPLVPKRLRPRIA